MKEIEEGIVYSNDINLILPSNIEDLRKDFKKTTEGIFSKVTIISEEDMISSISESIRDVLGIYPHCFTR